MTLSAVLTPAEEGGFAALNPETGTTTQGESVEEALTNLRAASPWQQTPHLTGRVAEEQDVKDGRAVFYLQDAHEIGAAYADIGLPRCGIFLESGTPVIIIQSERVDEKHYVGYRPLSGGNGICLISEVQLLEKPDERFH
jgi:hypothetical protein